MTAMSRPFEPADLVRTVDGHHGILLEPGPEPGTWIVSLGDGTDGLYPASMLVAVPLGPGSPRPSSFAELLRHVLPRRDTTAEEHKRNLAAIHAARLRAQADRIGMGTKGAQAGAAIDAALFGSPTPIHEGELLDEVVRRTRGAAILDDDAE